MVFQVKFTACCGESWTYLITADNMTQIQHFSREFISLCIPCAEYKVLNVIQAIIPPWDRYYQLGFVFLIRLAPGEFALTRQPTWQDRLTHSTSIRDFDHTF